jgi:transcriptional regulator GlxA family with amidase domain
VQPLCLGFLLLPHHSLMALGGALDALSHANELLGERVYRTSLLSCDGAAVVGAQGVPMAVQQSITAGLDGLDGIFVVSDTPLPETGHDLAVEALRTFAARGTLVGGIGTGAWLLARAGLLQGHRATIHWPYSTLLADRFADSIVSHDLHEIDRGRLTCAAGSASFHMMLTWLGERHGDPFVTAMVHHFGVERLRGRHEKQHIPLEERIGGGQPKLAEAVSLMEANLSEPLATEDIAQLVGVSRRQLERLFKQHLDSLPSRYYLELRLLRAQRLLQQTRQSILQIGLVCGFASGPHFSSAYRNRFGITPRDQRSQRAASVIGPASAAGAEEQGQ